MQAGVEEPPGEKEDRTGEEGKSQAPWVSVGKEHRAGSSWMEDVENINYFGPWMGGSSRLGLGGKVSLEGYYLQCST